MKRKEFLTRIGIGGSVLFISPIFFSSCGSDSDDGLMPVPNGTTIDLSSSQYEDLNVVGGFVYVQNIIVIRTGDTQYTALSKICTHQQCTVDYNASTNQLPCPCHGSVFSIGGTVLEGPANSALKKFSVVKDGNMLTIS